MKYKISELDGPMLDAAAAAADGYTPGKFGERNYYIETINDGRIVCLVEPHPGFDTYFFGSEFGADNSGWLFRPTIDWHCAGPIIVRELIGILPATKEIKADRAYLRRTGRHFMPQRDGWVAGYEPITHIEFDWGGGSEVGPTPLVAAMRVFVAAKFGAEVDL